MHKTSKLNWALVGMWALIAVLVLAGCNVTGLPSNADFAPTPSITATVAATARPIETPAPTFAPTAMAVEPTPTRTAMVSSTPEPANTGEPTAEPIKQVTVSPTATRLPLSERQGIFNDVWNTVDQNYLYPDFHGADWNALKAKYEPIAEKAQSSDEFYGAIRDMVAALNDDHSSYLSPAEAKEEDDLERGNADYVGIGILSSPEGKSVRVIYVFPNSPAEKAGITRRDRIVAVDGTPFVDPAKEIARVRGPAGTTVRLSIVSPEQAERVVPIVRGRVSGAVIPSSSRLSTDPSVGYLIIPNLWTDDMDVRVGGELNKLLAGSPDLKGLVIDMRGNGGGFRFILESILGDFVSGQVGTFFNQNTSYPLTITAKPLASKLSNVPVVFLVDKGTESYAEVMSASIQEKGRAKVVGVASAGNTETIFAYNMEDGSRLWCAQEGFKLLDGTNLEGRGVIPDVKVDVDWTAFKVEDDPQILKAVELLQANP
jgi:carboxyl-terminal processing protease